MPHLFDKLSLFHKSFSFPLCLNLYLFPLLRLFLRQPEATYFHVYRTGGGGQVLHSSSSLSLCFKAICASLSCKPLSQLSPLRFLPAGSSSHKAEAIKVGKRDESSLDSRPFVKTRVFFPLGARGGVER